jgi:hypothetical protein
MKTLPSSLTRRACLALTCAAVAVCLWSCGKGSSSANKGALPLEIEQMERLKDSDPEKALELYHSFKNGQAEWDDKKKADEKFPGIATAVYNKRLAEEDFQRCGDLFEEVKKTWPSTDLCKTLSSLWARDRVVWFKKAAGARDFETADRLLPEIPLNPDSPSWGEVMPVLPEYMEARWQNASATSDYAAVDKLFTEWLGNPVRSKNAQMQELLKKYIGWRLQAAMDAGDYGFVDDTLVGLHKNNTIRDYRWFRERGIALGIARAISARNARNSDEARKQLVAASGWYDGIVDITTLIKVLKEEWDTSQLVSIGDELARQKNPPAAAVFYEAASVSPSPPADIADRIDLSLLAGARYSARDGNRVADYERLEIAEGLYNRLLFQRDSFKLKGADWLAGCRELLHVQVAYGTHLGNNNEFARGEEILEAAARTTAVAIWAAEWNGPNYDGWKDVPPDVLKTINATNPGAEESVRREAAKSFAMKGAFPIPQAEAVMSSLQLVKLNGAKADANQGMQQLQSSREDAFRLLRGVLRRCPGTEPANIVMAGLQSEIRRANGQREYAALNDLLGFYVAEVGSPPPGDPFREELKRILRESADRHRDEPMVRVFLLSLLADAVTDDPSSGVAREEAMNAGLQMILTMPGQPMGKPAREIPSGMSGLSVLVIENQTRHHLLFFAEGRERFYVRLNPFRRGSVVLEDGTYEVAVVVTGPGVRPYRGKCDYQSVTQFTGYYIVETDSKGREIPVDAEELKKVTGDYALLRTPPGTGPFVVHPDLGPVFYAQGK